MKHHKNRKALSCIPTQSRHTFRFPTTFNLAKKKCPTRLTILCIDNLQITSRSGRIRPQIIGNLKILDTPFARSFFFLSNCDFFLIVWNLQKLRGVTWILWLRGDTICWVDDTALLAKSIRSYSVINVPKICSFPVKLFSNLSCTKSKWISSRISCKWIFYSFIYIKIKVSTTSRTEFCMNVVNNYYWL